MVFSSSFAVRHAISGRLRLRIPELERGNGKESDYGRVLEDLKNMTGILVVRCNYKCLSLIIRYDPAIVTEKQLLGHMVEYFPSAAMPAGRGRISKAPHVSVKGNSCQAAGSSCGCRAGQDDQSGALAKQLRRFSIVSSVAGLVSARSFFMGSAVSQAMFSPLGLAALVLSLPVFSRGIKDLRDGRPGLDSFLSGGLAASILGNQAMTAMEILWINSGAETLSAWIAERSRRHVAEILDLTSHHTFVLDNGVEVEREVSRVKPGEVVVLHTGEKVCVDGQVVHGEALVDEAPITGRDEGRHVRTDDSVFAGTFIQEGVIHVQAEKVGDETYLSRIMHKVQDSLENRAPVEGVADRLASRLVKLGMGATAATFLVTGSIQRAYTVLLVMACPCATVLAATTAVSAAMNAAARNHILIKGGRYLEEIGKCRTVYFDKTGTLTTTEPELKTTVCVNEHTEADQLLALAASAETHNHHPLARAILSEARRKKLSLTAHTECDYHMGMGMRARLNGDELLVGNAKLMKLYNADIQPLAHEAGDLQKQGLTVLYVSRNRELQGLLGFAAGLRPEAGEAIQCLRRMGVTRVGLITGDEECSAEQLARELGLDACHASAMPGEKADIIARAGAEHGPVLMVGDGINDALALARAEAGVAFGTAGSEVAVEAADIALVRDDFRDLAVVYALSHKTLRVAHQNFWLATGSNILGVVLGAAGMLTPVTAGLVHIVHSLGVVVNSSRLLSLPEVKLRTTDNAES